MGDEDSSRLKEIIEALKAFDGKPTKPDFVKQVKEESQNALSMADKENSGIIKMRAQWSGVVLWLIVGIVLFDMLLVTFYGLGIWDFKDNLVVIVVITDNFLKIVGLGFLITHSIFKKIFKN